MSKTRKQRALSIQRKRQGPEILTSMGITFESKNVGEHLIVRFDDGTNLSFWPSTGRWIDHGQDNQGHSIDSLIRFLGKE